MLLRARQREAMSSLGSALAIAMMVGGGGAPPWPRGLVQTGSAHRVGHTVLFGSGLLPRWSGACPALVSRLISYDTWARGPDVIRQLTKVGRGLRERSRVPERASQWNGRITS
jgi:hypothetical protein